MLNWLESRTGFVSMTKEFLTEDVPGGASYWYVFGSATLFAMMVQIVTGIFLTFFYAPSAATARPTCALRRSCNDASLQFPESPTRICNRR